MKLIVITTPDYFVEEDQIIKTLFDEGLDCLHLRKPNTPATYAERLLKLIPEKYHKRIVTHEHFSLTNEFNLKGIHLNYRNPIIPDGYKGQVSASCHTIDEVITDRKTCNYVFLSPIFNSISKQGYEAAFTSEELHEASHKGIINKNVYALGGINPENIPLIKDYGFGGAVVLGDLWNKFNRDRDDNYQELIKHFIKLKKLTD